MRDEYLKKDTENFLRDCKCENFKATGPGGQRKNKVCTAVRLTHIPTSLTAYATESRHRRENLLKAVKKLKMAIAFNVRCSDKGNLNIPACNISLQNPEYPLFAARVLDIIEAHNSSLKEAASVFKLSTSQFIKILKKDKKLWQKVLSMTNKKD